MAEESTPWSGGWDGGIMGACRCGLWGWRTSSLLSPSLLAVVAIVGSLAAGVDRQTALSTFLITNTAIGLSAAPCGLLIARAKPSNPIGWLFLVAGIAPLLTAAMVPVMIYGDANDWPTGVVRLGVTISMFSWSWGVFCCLPLALQLFPTGKPLSPRWRWLGWLTVANAALGNLFVGPTPEYGASSYLVAPWWSVTEAVVRCTGSGDRAALGRQSCSPVRPRGRDRTPATVVAGGRGDPGRPRQRTRVVLHTHRRRDPPAVELPADSGRGDDRRAAARHVRRSDRSLPTGPLRSPHCGGRSPSTSESSRCWIGCCGAAADRCWRRSRSRSPSTPPGSGCNGSIDRALYGARRDPVAAVSAVGRRLAAG